MRLHFKQITHKYSTMIIIVASYFLFGAIEIIIIGCKKKYVLIHCFLLHAILVYV